MWIFTARSRRQCAASSGGNNDLATWRGAVGYPGALLILILLKLSVAVDNLELLRHDLREAAGYGRSAR
jgi:hypothetical protein